MRLILTSFLIAFVVCIGFVAELNAGEICKDMTSANSNEVDTKLLALIDNLLEDWPQHAKIKKIMSKKELLENFKDSRQVMIVECAKGNEFQAGFALGNDLAIYKMMLLQMTKELDSVP